jgi:putative Mn2+ efflux pump MntP
LFLTNFQMNNFEIVILSLALVLCSRSFRSRRIPKQTKSGNAKRYNTAAALWLFESLLVAAGMGIGIQLSGYAEDNDTVISLSLLFIVGLTIILTGFRSLPVQNKRTATDSPVYWLNALPEGMPVLATAVSVGLISESPLIHALIFISALGAGMIFQLFEKPSQKTPAGILQSEMLAGILLLAAAIKLALNLTGY